MRCSRFLIAYSSSIAAALSPTARPPRRTSRRSAISWAGCTTPSMRSSSSAPRRRSRMSTDVEGTLAVRRGAVAMLRPFALPLFAVLVAALVGAALVAVLGEDPVAVYGTLIGGSVVGWPNLSVSLQNTTPLIFTGLAVAIAFRAGLWNIGAEGQLLMGALAAGIVGYALPLPPPFHVVTCLIAAFLGGLAWAAIPAILRVYLNVNELVVCLMMNPIALLATGYVATHALKAPGPTNKLPDIQDSAVLTNFSVFSQLNSGIFI